MDTGSFDNDQASLVLTEVDPLQGIYPGRGDGGTAGSDTDTLGVIRTFAYNFAPAGSDAAQGQTLSISQYPALFSIQGTPYGGNGASNFDLPNLAGRVVVGSSTAAGNNAVPLGSTAGQDQATVSQAQLPPSLGGSSQPVSNAQPSQAITYAIRTTGDVPSSTSPAGEVGFLGQVVAFTGPYVPDGFVLADGSTLQVAQYPQLFAVIGTTYGGNGTTTFALPNLVGSNVVGASSTTPLGTKVGASNVVLTTANAPAAYGGSGQPIENRTPGVALNYIINTSSGDYPQRPGSGTLDGSSAYLGEIEAFAGPAAQVPEGWMLANGQTLSITQNTALFSLLGTQFGGNGTTTFALPDLRDRVVVGSGTSSSSGQQYTVGETFGSNTALLAVSGSNICFCTGTLIRTARDGVEADVAVEALAVGDMVVTASGAHRPIRWIGHRRTRCDTHPEPRKVWPVRVRAGTFGEGLPYADLWLSPGHALCLDGCLVPVRGLLDGERISQVERAEVTYWHVELDSHDVLIANGMPAESYLDTGNRRGFSNAHEVIDGAATLLHFSEDAAPSYDGTGYCLPLVEAGARLTDIRARYGLGRPALRDARDANVAAHLVADGAVTLPCLAGENELRFLLPAEVSEARLVTPSFAATAPDVRRLGVIVSSLAVSDGAGWQEIALDDRGLFAGFHDVEREGDRAWRWTSGEAHLAASLWAGLDGPLLLRLTGVFVGLQPTEAEQPGERDAA